MALTTYTLWLDGVPYCGESEQTEANPAGPWGHGWLVWLPDKVSALAFGTGAPHRIEGVRNMRSHLERILSRVERGDLRCTSLEIRTEPASRPTGGAAHV